MRDLYNKLTKILRLEQQKNFNNSVVIGGLEGFLAFWLAEGRAKASNNADRRRVEEVSQRLYGYGNMSPEERAPHVLYLIERLGAGNPSVGAERGAVRGAQARGRGDVGTRGAADAARQRIGTRRVGDGRTRGRGAPQMRGEDQGTLRDQGSSGQKASSEPNMSRERPVARPARPVARSPRPAAPPAPPVARSPRPVAPPAPPVARSPRPVAPSSRPAGASPPPVARSPRSVPPSSRPAGPPPPVARSPRSAGAPSSPAGAPSRPVAPPAPPVARSPRPVAPPAPPVARSPRPAGAPPPPVARSSRSAGAPPPPVARSSRSAGAPSRPTGAPSRPTGASPRPVARSARPAGAPSSPAGAPPPPVARSARPAGASSRSVPPSSRAAGREGDQPIGRSGHGPTSRPLPPGGSSRGTPRGRGAEGAINRELPASPPPAVPARQATPRRADGAMRGQTSQPPVPVSPRARVPASPAAPVPPRPVQTGDVASRERRPALRHFGKLSASQAQEPPVEGSGGTTGPHRESSPNSRRGGGSSAQPSWGPTNTKRAAPRRRSLPPEVALRLDGELDRPVTSLPGVGKSRAKKLEKLNISTIRHLLYHAPFRYEDYTTMKQIAELRPGDEVTLAVVVQDIDMYRSKRGTVVVTAMVSDGSGRLQVKWFGNRYLVNHLRKGTMVRLSGKIDAYMGRLQLGGPRFEVVNESEVRGGDLIPIYSRTEGLSEKALSKYITLALSEYAGRIPDPLPSEIREHYELIGLSQAIRWVHQASSMEQVQAAQKRLAFDELLRVQLGMLQQRAAWQNQPGNTIQADHAAIERFYGSLPFELTGAQKRCVEEILLDMGQSYAMSRLLQGDVGSGKTAVAATALIAAVSAGFQGALMAPTEILAEQHFAGVSKFLNPEGTLFLEDRPIRLALLTGSLSASEKREARDAIAKGEADVVIGTHAIIQEDVTFPKLGLAIVDEQHRFGVKQRSALRKRTSDGVTPDLLVMSATPIPRSLALTLYGDLELSLIDEMPPGRQPIVTRTITPQLRERAYTYIRRQIQSGRQAFIICPLVEESEKLEARAAVEEHAFLQQQVFPEYSVELLHGRMKSSEKEAAMARFYRNDSQILVSTSVVEVGIDVPNANVMLIEGANRFGLAQLHQFRGRIGRGQWRSLCLLMAEEGISEEAQQRLQALVDNSDGFALAEEDLKMRGPGDFFGTRQSGMLELKMAKLGDTLTLSKAREVAKQILYHDPKLEHPAHQLLKAQTEKSWNKEADGAS